MANELFLGQDLDIGFVADEEGRVYAGPYSPVICSRLCEKTCRRTKLT